MPLFDLRKDIQNIKQSIGKPFDGVKSGINSLDNFILGFGKGEMSTIAGRPGMGKSSMARDILLKYITNILLYWQGAFPHSIRCPLT